MINFVAVDVKNVVEEVIIYSYGKKTYGSYYE